MTFNQIVVLDVSEKHPVQVQFQGSSILITDLTDTLTLTRDESVKLVELLTQHYNL